MLLHCKVSRALWELAINRLGICWVAPNSVNSHLLAWEGLFGRKVRKKHKVGWMFLHVIFWCIWRERNRRAFEGIETPFQRLKDIVLKAFFFFGRAGSSAPPLLSCFLCSIACIWGVHSLLLGAFWHLSSSLLILIYLVF